VETIFGRRHALSPNICIFFLGKSLTTQEENILLSFISKVVSDFTLNSHGAGAALLRNTDPRIVRVFIA